MTEFKDVAETMDIGPKKHIGKNKLFLIISGGVLVVALIVCAIVLLGAGASGDTERVIELGTVMDGVSVGGIDISGMTRDEALAATSGLEAQLFAQANFTVDVNGIEMNFTAQDFALQTDYEAVIDKAVAYGRTGTFDERLAAANTAKESPVDFPVIVSVDETGLKTALTALKAQLDTEPVDATATFVSWGYTAETGEDGTVTYTPYEPSLEEMIDICTAYSKNKEYTDFPELVRLVEEDMPNALRYEYWNDRKGSNGGYEEEPVPRDADISRFIYTDSVDGLIVDIDAIAEAVKSQVLSGMYETIVAPTTVTPATVTLEDIQSQTQLIASWSSSYGGSGHTGSDRKYNVAMMSTLLNGSVIEPGGTWSVNDTAGPRNATTAEEYGWREAAGIENGGYTAQYGGGVCQLGSTTYNAAIRAGLTTAEDNGHWHHSIPSGYIPIGLDATLDSPRGTSAGKDLKLQNDTEYTYYLVSYIDPVEKSVTVEFYGVPLTNDAGDQIIRKFSSRQTGRFGTPVSKVVSVPEGYECPDGTIISSDPAIGKTTYQFAQDRQGTYARVEMTTIGLDGVQIGDTVEFDRVTYPVINGTTYVLEEPEPTETTSTEPSESPSASESSGT